MTLFTPRPTVMHIKDFLENLAIKNATPKIKCGENTSQDIKHDCI